ncbi:uncharacterized protein LOC106137065 [Amyelois transitella]|uniref:uncharacterized protein LOC106137065 n=1 Tax=Amyelois transitella TaxID=680683 RepID=UPI00298F7C57|nr:uncharacterized protein LOC106137065 [Amyelois transitella]
MVIGFLQIGRDLHQKDDDSLDQAEPRIVSDEDKNSLLYYQPVINENFITAPDSVLMNQDFRREKRQIGSSDTQMMIGTFQAIVRPMTASNPLGGLTSNNAEIVPEEKKEDQNHMHSKWLAVPHCTISGFRAWSLQICRIMGFAPLTFEREGSGWTMRVSGSSYLYSLFLITALNITGIITIYMDITFPERAILLNSSTKAIIWSINFSVAAFAITISAIKAPTTMKAMIGFMNRVQKINLQINNNFIWIERRCIVVMLIILILAIMLSAYDCYSLLMLVRGDYRKTIIGFLYISHYWFYLSPAFIILQFGLNVLSLQTALKTINDHLESLCHRNINKGFHSIQDRLTKSTHDILFHIVVPIKSVNIEIDQLTNNTDVSLPTKTSVHDTIRSLTLKFLDICDLIEEVNKYFGGIVLMVLATNLIQLVITWYYTFIAIFTKPQITMQIAWCLKQLATLLLLTEPCHWTQQELGRARLLISHLSSERAIVIGPMVAELRKFSSCLRLTKATYSPLGICTLARPVCVSVIGSVITYLVILIQFNTDIRKK